jgi:TctA family transporter
MVLLGLLLAQVNTDPLAGAARYGLAFPELAGGIGLVGLAMGLFGLADVVARLGMPAAQREVFSKKLSGRWPTRQDVMDAWPAMVRGTAVGSVLGLLPGASARLAAVAAYTVEKEVPAKAGEIAFGRGNIRGVAGPEAANSAGAQTSFIPLLTLGVAPSAVTALMMGAMTIKGIHPGPQLLTANPQWFWGLVASMWVGHLMLAILNLPLIGLWGKLLAVPYRLVFPAMIVLCCIGLYSLNNRSLDVFVGAAFAVVGYFFHKLGCEPAPLLLGYILWPTMEENLRRALLASDGDWGTFLARPLSAGLLIAAALMVFVVRLPTIKKQRQTVFGDDL